MMLLDSVLKGPSVVTHIVQKFVKHVNRIVSVQWEFSPRGSIEITIDQSCRLM